MTANGIKVTNYLKSVYPNEKTKEEIVAATGLTQPQVQAALTGFGSLKRLGLLNSRNETATEADEKGKYKVTYYYVLNEDGLAYEA